jgi:hypothetical protein
MNRLFAIFALLSLLLFAAAPASAVMTAELKNRSTEIFWHQTARASGDECPASQDRIRDAAIDGYDFASDVSVGPNLYAYVKQNPWTSFDPTGLFEVSPHQPIHELITVKAYANAIGASDQNALNAAKAGNASVKTAAGSLAAGVKSPDLGKVTGRSAASLLLGPLGPVIERADQLHSLHYGDQQWKHSMSSTEKTAGELRDKIVKGLTDQFSSARKQFEAGNEAAAWATMGEVLHTVQDSYSASHTTRDPKTGEIMGYNSYPAQDGKKHATADSVSGGSFKSGLRGINIDDYSGVESKAGVREATSASTNIISAFMKGDASAFGKQLNETYRTSPKAEVGKSGGYGKDDP